MHFFLIDMGASEVAVSTTGYGIRLLSDARIDKILDAVVEHLAEGEAAQAAQAFLNMVTDYASQDVSQSQNGFQAEGKVPPQQKKSFLKAAVQALPISLIIGIVSVGAIYLACGRSGKSEVRPKSYRYYSSLQLSRKEDRLVDKHVSTRRLPRNNPPPGAGRSFGGSSTHSSSSGRIHGGGSRSFGGSSTRISSSGRRHGGGKPEILGRDQHGREDCILVNIVLYVLITGMMIGFGLLFQKGRRKISTICMVIGPECP